MKLDAVLRASQRATPFRAEQQSPVSFFEFWPAWLFYTPVVVHWIALGLRYRDMLLPTAANPLIGREREVAAACALLRRAAVRLVTLTGPGGVGKTTLALAAAHAAAGQFADGAAFISLETLTDPALIRDTAARQLGIPTPASS